MSEYHNLTYNGVVVTAIDEQPTNTSLQRQLLESPASVCFHDITPPFTHVTIVVEVAIHTILYVRHVYPAELFVRRKIYDTAVYQSRHPALNDYISEAMKAIAEELALVCYIWMKDTLA